MVAERWFAHHPRYYSHSIVVRIPVALGSNIASLFIIDGAAGCSPFGSNHPADTGCDGVASAHGTQCARAVVGLTLSHLK